MQARTSMVIILTVIIMLLPVSIACKSSFDTKEAKECFSEFMEAGEAKDIDKAWSLCYEPTFLGKGEIEFFINNYHNQVFEGYEYFTTIDSDGGKIDDISAEFYPELSGKTGASLKGRIYFDDGTSILFDILLLKVGNTWKIASFYSPDIITSTIDSTPSELPPSDSLIIDDVKLCSDLQDSTHYTVNMDSYYIQGQVIYLLFNIHGVSSNWADDHYEVYLNISRLALINSDGEEIANQTIDIKSPQAMGGDALSFPMWLTLGAPLDAPRGEYSIELEVTDMFSNKTVDIAVPLSIDESPITINNLHFCSDIDGLGDYVLQPNNTYEAGDRVYVYLEIPGLSLNTVEGQNIVWLKCSKFKVYDTQGNSIMDINNVTSEQFVYDDPYGPLYFNIDFLIPPSTEEGLYYFDITVEDGWTGENKTETVQFYIENDDTYEFEVTS